jgi:RHS repeat-associated protein
VTSSTITNNLRFPGQYYDSETGLNYNYFRTYDPTNGRYKQSDPISLNGGINTFGYGNGNPLRITDPFGLWPTCEKWIKRSSTSQKIRNYYQDFTTNIPWLWPVGSSVGPDLGPSSKSPKLSIDVIVEVWMTKIGMRKWETYSTTILINFWHEYCTDSVKDKCGKTRNLFWTNDWEERKEEEVLINTRWKTVFEKLYKLGTTAIPSPLKGK